MKLQQLHYLCTIVEHDLNLSSAATALRRTQPGVSRAIRLLEEELGTILFLRRGRRLIEITSAGREIVQIARSMLANERAIRTIGSEFTLGEKGQLVVGTTHTNARYSLPETIKRFAARFPDVRLVLREGTADEIAQWASQGTVDVIVGARASDAPSNLAFISCFQLDKVVLAPKGHELCKDKVVTLESILRHPIVTYHAMANRLRRHFEANKLRPNIVLSTEDVDVMKTYVRIGLGIGISPHVAYDASHDRDLTAIPVGHLLRPTTICVGVNSDCPLPGVAFEFIQMLDPKLRRAAIEREQANARARRAKLRNKPLVWAAE